MSFPHDKQKGVVFVMPILWIITAIGFTSVMVLKNNESPAVEVSKKSETYKQAELLDTELQEVTGPSNTDEE